jgi:hypothetical protein
MGGAKILNVYLDIKAMLNKMNVRHACVNSDEFFCCAVAFKFCEYIGSVLGRLGAVSWQPEEFINEENDNAMHLETCLTIPA